MKFRSKFEQKFYSLFPSNIITFEPVKLEYKIPETQHKYTPDFHITGTNIYFETKGIWTTADRKKMLLVKQQHPDKRFIMVFQDPKKPISKNSKTSYADWANKNNIEWMLITDIKKLLIDYNF